MLNIIQTGLSSAKKVFVLNLPGILHGMAVGGVVITGIEAFKAGMNCKEVMIENGITEENWTEEWKKLAPIVAKPVGTGLITIFCIAGAATKSQRIQAAMASACAMDKDALNELDKKAREEYGDKKVDKLYSSISEEKVKNNPPDEKTVIVTGNGEYLIYEPLTARYFRSEINHVKAVINVLNEEINGGAFISVNDYCDRICGMPDSQINWDIGWSLETTGIISIKEDYTGAANGEPCLILEHRVRPEVKRYYDN